jgi:hypothetical protein
MINDITNYLFYLETNRQVPMESQTRGEQLALYRQQKLLKESAKGTKKSAYVSSKSTVVKPRAAPGSMKSKVQLAAAKSTIFQSSTRSSAKNDRNVVNAGKKRIGASTPIGKLQARLRAGTSSSSASNKENVIKCNKNLFGSDDSTSCVKTTSTFEFNKAIQAKLDEADYLNKKHGCHVARAYLEELPKDDECAHFQLLSKAIYWLAWIQIERKAHHWERVEKLFLQAESLVRSVVDKKMIAAAYEAFREDADKILDAKMESMSKG